MLSPSNSFVKLTAPLPKKHIAMIIWLRTNHISLNLHLHRIRKADTPLCPHCKTTENLHHFLNNCPHYARARHIRRNELGRLADNIPYLLTNPEAIKPLIQYVNATGRLKNTFGNPHPHTTQ